MSFDTPDTSAQNPEIRYLESVLQLGHPFGKTIVSFGKAFRHKGHLFMDVTINHQHSTCLAQIAEEAAEELDKCLGNNGDLSLDQRHYHVQRKPRDGSFYTYLIQYNPIR